MNRDAVQAFRLQSSNDVTAAYDSLAPLVQKYWGADLHYGYWTGPDDHTPIQQATARLTTIVVDKLSVDPRCRVLDIGCGHGRPAVTVGKVSGAQVIGVDGAPENIEGVCGKLAAELLGTSPAAGLLLAEELNSLRIGGDAALLARLEISLGPAIHTLDDCAPQS